MQKLGQTKIITAVLVIIAICAVFGVGYMVYANGKKAAIIPPTPPVEGCPDSAATVSFSAVDNGNQATTVTTTERVKINGGASADSTTSYAVGSNLEILWSNATTWEDMITTYSVPCGGGQIVGLIKDYNPGTITIRNDEGTQTLTDDILGGAQNATALGAGGSGTYQIKIKGADKDTTSSTIIVVEQNSSTACEAAQLALSGGAEMPAIDIPSVGAVSNTAGAKLTAFKIPAIEGNTNALYDLTLSAKSSQICAGGVYITFYPEQALEDTDGTFKVGVENSIGTAKHQSAYDYDFFITSG